MGEIIAFHRDLDAEPEIESMNRNELLRLQEQLRAAILELDEIEPQDQMSEEYEDWGERHEQLEDLADDVQDRLDELQ